MPKNTENALDCSALTDPSESGLVRFMDEHKVFGEPIEEPIDLQPPADPCESLELPTDSRQIRRSCGGRRAPGDDPCYDEA